MTIARTGKEAPDFEATAYIQGKGFQNIHDQPLRGADVVARRMEDGLDLLLQSRRLVATLRG